MKALLIVDMQQDFMPGGALPTKGADKLVPFINQLMNDYSLVIATKDWHPKNHMSFAENHPGKQMGDIIEVEGIDQILWPVHCVQGTKGADFVSGLNEQKIRRIFYKGVDRAIDSYSTFYDNAKLRETGLASYLRQHQVDEIVIVGVATDYCVLYSVLDALELGFKVTVLTKGCRPINQRPGDEMKALAKMKEKGAIIQ